MKFIVVGLGNFGASLAEKLTQQGNEVIGIDVKIEKVNAFKEKISYTICMDATNKETVSDLPLQNTDIVMICIGEDQGVNVMATALFKNLNVKRLISRSNNTLHEDVLKAIGVDEIVRPEEETAERWAKKLCLKGVLDSFELNKDHSIIEVKVPDFFVGQTIEKIGFRQNHNILILTIFRKTEKNSFLGKRKDVTVVQGIPDPGTIIEREDVLVIYGAKKDLNKFVKYKAQSE